MRCQMLMTAALAIGSALPTSPAVSADAEPWRYPEFTLPELATRRPVSLSDYRGKKVLLIQFASW